MRSSFLSTATVGAALLLGTTGVSRRAQVATPDSGQNKSITSPKPKTSKKVATCSKGDLCDDPVVLARKFGQQEANETLQQTICGFLAEYGLPNEDTKNAQQHGAHPNNTYCPALGAGAVSQKRVTPLVTADGVAKVNRAVRPKVVIAVLPDPVHTELALRFDESTDELENSIQDLGWTYDRAWLPWDAKEHEDEPDFDQRMENKSGQEGYETVPGAIMFRAPIDEENTKHGIIYAGTTRPLIVLVVGDTPTGGVDRTAFRKAIAMWQQLTGWNNYFLGKSGGADDADNPSDASELDILGPTYSGSVPSLQGLIREVTAQIGTKGTTDQYFCPSANKKFKVWVSSGTISEEEKLYNLSSTPQGRTNPSGKPVNDCLNLEVVVTSMAANTDNEWLAILDLIERHQSVFSKSVHSSVVVARLSEAESTFGTAPVLGSQEDYDKLVSRMLPELSVAKMDYYARQVASYNLLRRVNPLHFYFPREISSLRTAYEQNKIFGFNSRDDTVQTQLHLSLGRNTHADDTIHTFSGAENAAALEAAMGELARELGRSKVDVVVLSATDVLDEIFVTRYLAQHSPNTTVIVMDTDGLFLRSGDSTMQNAYVIGPWPLLPGNEMWSAPPNPKIPELPPVRLHDSAGGQGLYNAVRYLMCVPTSQPMMKCGVTPNSKVTLSEYKTPIAIWAARNSNHLLAAPPLWLSVVERGNFWPISLVDLDQVDDGLPGQNEWPGEYRRNLPLIATTGYQDHGHLATPDTQGIQESVPASILVAASLIGLLLLAHVLACLLARLDRTYAWSYALAHRHHHWLRWGLQVSLALLMVPALVLLKTPNEGGVAFCGLRDYCIYPWVNQCLRWVAVGVSCIPLAQLTGLWPWPKSTRKRIVSGLCTLLMLALEWTFMKACELRLWEAITPSSNKWPSERAFFFYRSGHLFSGSAPNLPVLLLGSALAVFLWSIFARLAFYDDRIPVLPEVKDTGLNCPSTRSMARLNGLLSGTWDRRRLSILGVAAVAVSLLYLGLHDVVPRSLNHGRFDVVVSVLTGIVCSLLIYDLAVAVTAWSLLRIGCLLPLGRSPLRWGFTWIKGFSWRRIWAPGENSPENSFDYLRRIAEANRRAMSDSKLDAAFESLREQIRDPKQPYAAWAAEVTARMGALHIALAESATNKINVLRLQWSLDFGPITGTDVKDDGLIERGLREERLLEKYELPQDAAGWRQAQDRMAREEFVALLYLGYIRLVLLQIRNRIITATMLYVLLLWALTCYPFLNHHSLLIGLTCLFTGLAASVIWIYAQMHRDEILSRTTETSSGKLDADFYTKILAMVGIPLVTLIASQFPEVSNTVFSWLEPGLSAMK